MPAEIVGQSDIGIMLYGKKSGDTKFTELVEIKDVPESGNDPEQIEVTTLKRSKKVYVAGREDVPTQTFTYNYTEENYFTKVLPYADGTTINEFLVKFQDGTGTLITGSAVTRKNSVSLDSAVEASLVITPTEIEDKTSAEVTALIS
jgi:hypothetical protein